MSQIPSLPETSLLIQVIDFEISVLDSQGMIIKQLPGQAHLFSEALPADLALELIALPGGTFQMGSIRGLGYEDETPRHLVSLNPFFLGRYPVTQAQWQSVMQKAPGGRFHGPRLPVENVSWKEANEFCRRLSKKTGRSYHLPSEAQWEYACRAGTSSPFSTGETITTASANYCGEHTFREEPRGLYRHATSPVDLFPPNPFGLSDMHGNLWEWCADRWHPDYTGAPFDGTAWEMGGEEGYRVARGGSWHEPPANCRSATRLRVNEKDRDDFIGFRVAMNWL